MPTANAGGRLDSSASPRCPPWTFRVPLGTSQGGWRSRWQGGAKLHGVMYAIVAFHRSKESLLPAGSIAAPKDGEFPFQRSFTLSEFMKSPSGYTGGRAFTRREVIKYLANVKGGVHLSATERKKEEKLIERLSKAEKRFQITTRNHPLPVDALVLEALAIGQCLARSADAQRYISRTTTSPL